MQILLLIKPSSLVREFNITSRQTMIGLVVVLLALFGVGWMISILMNQIEDKYPSTMRVSLVNHEMNLRNDSDYERKLLELQVRLQEMQADLEKLNMANQDLVKLRRPSNLNIRSNNVILDSSYRLPSNKSSRPQSASLRFDQQPQPLNDSYGVRLDLAFQKSINLNDQITTLQNDFAGHNLPVANSPSGLPLPFRVNASSGFGYRTDPITGQVAWHHGTDFPAPRGTLILSTGGGIVIKSGWGGDFGNMVEVQHPSGVITRYAHAQELMVKVGQTVKQSQPIARVGSTGRSTSPHLHYEVL